ncbi:glycolate oxidase FAD binding subunit [Jhaorihella thermophila]|uniref:Glycolate oxidase FAD binding subunit n=2 Tax=Jhaorihella thermophila TaxID=488547 RepID=A0A1H5WG71_9RHOB|nr:glycolate oxidase FAD binding subunit [Jhaorihella thermophila]
MKIMTPATEAELAELVAGAYGPLAPRGGNTRGVPVVGDILSVAGLRGVELYEPGALTLVVKAGTPLAEVEQLLAGENQRLAFEPMDLRGLLGTKGEPTIGGVFAANVSGPRRVQAGAARDFLLGVRYVDGGGRVIRNGGRVMKNVTGYDLVKLMAGSWGTLGVLSEVSLKVLPRAETQATVRLHGVDVKVAVKAMAAALGSPFEVTGAAHDPAAAEGPVVMVRIEGFEASVAYRCARLTEVLRIFGDVSVLDDPDASAVIWRDIRDVAAFHGKPGDVWRLSVKPSEAPEIAERLQADALLFDWGGGLIWARVPEGTNLRARAGAFDGHATIIRASVDTCSRLGMFQPEPATVAALSRGLRAKFDPRGIFNPGLMDAPVEA